MQATANTTPTNIATNTMRTSTRISNKELKSLLSFLKLLRLHVNDFSMVNGAFRTLSNDRSYIVETGFPFFKDMSFDVAEIYEFHKKLLTFKKETDISFSLIDNELKVVKYQYKIGIKNPDPTRLDNKFISYDQFDRDILSVTDTNQLMMSAAVKKRALLVIAGFAKICSFSRVQLIHDENNLSIGHLSMKNRDQLLESQIKNPFLIPLEQDTYIDLPIVPFTHKKSDLYLKIYRTTDGKVLIIYSTIVEGLLVNFYYSSEICQIGNRISK